MKSGKLAIFDLSTPGKEKLIKEISCIETDKEIRIVKFCRQNNEVLCGDELGLVSVWSLRTGESLRTKIR